MKKFLMFFLMAAAFCAAGAGEKIFNANGIVWKPAKQWKGESTFGVTGDYFTISRQFVPGTAGAWCSDPIAVKPGEFYRFTAEVMGENLTGSGRAAVRVEFLDKNGKRHSSRELLRVRNRRNFLVNTLKIAIPDGVAQLRLYAALTHGGGNAKFRNIALKKFDYPPVFATGTTALSSGGTRLYWRTAVPANGGSVTFKSPGMPAFTVAENVDGAENHKIDLPAATFAPGTQVSAVISYPDTPGVTVKFTAGKKAELQASQPFAVPLQVVEPTATPRGAFPVRSGVPFARGVLRSAADAVLCDADGSEIPAEFEELVRWDDGSVKFLICTFESSTVAGEPVKYTLTRRKQPGRKFPEVSGKVLPFIRKLSGTIVTASGEKLFWRAADATVSIRRSAVCETAVIDGTFSGKAGFSCRLTVRAFASGTVTVKWHLIGGKNDELLKCARWELPGLTAPELADGRKAGTAFKVAQYTDKDAPAAGFVRDRAANVSVSMRHFRETYPKAVAQNENVLSLQILPPLPAGYPGYGISPRERVMKYFWLKNGCYTYRAGMELTGEFTVSTAGMTPEQLNEPLFAAAAPQYYCSTGIFGDITARTPGEFDKFEKMISESMDTITEYRNECGEYGWMNFGDWFGERFYNWGNNEYDMPMIMAVMFARTGEMRYFTRGLEMAQHYQSIDRYTHRAKPMETKVHYKHSLGHIGGFLTKNSPELQGFNLRAAIQYPAFDKEGGHDFDTGSLLISALAGDRDMFDKTVANIEHTAQAFTVTPIIGIERSLGWLLDNLVGGAQMVHDGYLRNGADICVENICARQGKNGSLELPAGDCSCPDRTSHRGGKTFALGILMHSLIEYHRLTGSAEARNAVINISGYLLQNAWDSSRELFIYIIGCPESKGKNFDTLVLDGLLTASLWSGDPRGTELVKEYLGRYFPKISKEGGSQGVGKHFAMAYRHMPHIFARLKSAGITDLQIKPFKLGEILPVPADAIAFEAENFTAQSGGNVMKRTDKAATGMCLSHWQSSGHALSWQLKNPSGRYRLMVRYCTDRADVMRKLLINGVETALLTVPESKGLGAYISDWNLLYFTGKDGKPATFELPENALLTLESVRSSLNPDCFYLVPVR